MIGFRVDANESIATGHLVRCISIAEECKKRGIPCLFLLAEEKETKRLEERHLPYRILHTEWNQMESEYPVIFPILEQNTFDWIIVDSYQASRSYLCALNEKVPVLYIDDMASDIYPVSAVLHYSQWADDDSYRQKYSHTKTHTLVGMQYTPLREEFQSITSVKPRQKSILITTGGTDPFHITEKLLSLCLENRPQSLSDIPVTTYRKFFTDYTFEVIIGSMNQNEAALKKLAQNYPQVHLHKNITNMGDFMRNCEIAVSAGGTTLFELCACSIPTVCFSFADNQETFTKQLGERNVMLYAGDARYDTVPENIARLLTEFADDSTLRSSCALRMNRLVDGQGVRRIADFLVASSSGIPE